MPRLAATTVAGNRLARRWATAAPYGGLQEVRWAGDRKGRPYGGGGVKFSEFLGCCTGEGNGGGNGEGGEGIGENYKEV